MNKNGKRRPQRPNIKLVEPTATDVEAAAISAALEQFLRETAPIPQTENTFSQWQRSAVSEATGQSSEGDSWGNGSAWG